MHHLFLTFPFWQLTR